MPVQLIITISDAGHATVQTTPQMDQASIVGILNDMAKSVAMATIASLSPPAIEVPKPEQFSSLLGRAG
jgi:hypothetical protein